MLILQAYNLTEISRDYLLSVLIGPEKIVDIVTRRFETHLNVLSNYDSCDFENVVVRTTIGLIEKDFRLMFELNCCVVDMFGDSSFRVFSDDYLKSVQERFDLVMKVFKNEK